MMSNYDSSYIPCAPDSHIEYRQSYRFFSPFWLSSVWFIVDFITENPWLERYTSSVHVVWFLFLNSCLLVGTNVSLSSLYFFTTLPDKLQYNFLFSFFRGSFSNDSELIKFVFSSISSVSLFTCPRREIFFVFVSFALSGFL